MRGPSRKEILQTPPPGLRSNSKMNHALFEMRRKILEGDYQPEQGIIPRTIEEEYGLNNVGSLIVLLRLAVEGLVKIFPIRAKTRATNAAYNEYRVADLDVRRRMDSTRQGDFVSDIANAGNPTAYKQKLDLKVQYADAEIAALLGVREGAPVVYYRNLQRRDADTIVCINDCYLPDWFIPLMPELEKPDCDIYELMRRLGKKPTWCRETVDVVQASSVERDLFGMAADDPSSLLKILRRSFDEQGNPLEVQFLTDRGDIYRLHYSFPLYKEGIPEPFREK